MATRSIGRAHRLEAGRPSIVHRAGHLAGRALLWFEHLLEVRRQRRSLDGMHEELLRDIGLSRSELERERERWFWDLPPR